MSVYRCVTHMRYRFSLSRQQRNVLCILSGSRRFHQGRFQGVLVLRPRQHPGNLGTGIIDFFKAELSCRENLALLFQASPSSLNGVGGRVCYVRVVASDGSLKWDLTADPGGKNGENAFEIFIRRNNNDKGKKKETDGGGGGSRFALRPLKVKLKKGGPRKGHLHGLI